MNPAITRSARVQAYGRVAARYARGSRFTWAYVRNKLASDPVTHEVIALGARTGLGHVLDLGCGRGQLGLALLEGGVASRISGLDWDERLLAEARTAAEGLPAEFQIADLRSASLPAADTVLLVDVLYQLLEEDQLALIERAATAAKQRLLLRLFDPQRGWRSAFGRLSELGITTFRLYRPHPVRPMPVTAIAQLLQAQGFTVNVQPCWGSTLLPNVLLVADRVGASSAAPG